MVLIVIICIFGVFKLVIKYSFELLLLIIDVFEFVLFRMVINLLLGLVKFLINSLLFDVEVFVVIIRYWLLCVILVLI